MFLQQIRNIMSVTFTLKSGLKKDASTSLDYDKKY